MKLRPLFQCVFIVGVAAFAASAENWPRFRGPNGQGISSETDPPVKWSKEENIAWKALIPGKGWSSPIVWEDHVFVTSVTNEDTDCHVLCLDRSSGRVVWDTLAFQQKPPHKEQKNSHATPTPVTDGERIYAVFGDGGVVALGLDGQILWTNREIQHYSRHGLGSSPIIHDGLLIMPYDGSNRVAGPGKWPKNSAEERIGWQTPWDQALIAAFDVNSGKRIWTGRRGMSRIAHTTPIVVNDPADNSELIVSTAGDVIQGFDPNSGERLWTVHSQGEGVTPSPVVGDGLIFTSSGFEKLTLRTIRLGGHGDVTSTHIAWEESTGAPTQSSLLFASPYLYSITDKGVAHCYEGATGKVIWKERIGGNFCASPVHADDMIYFLDEEGTTTIIRAGKDFEILARNEIGEHCQASLAVSQDNFFLRGDSHLYCIGPRSKQ